MPEPRFDVFAIRIDDRSRRLIAAGLTEADAYAYVKMTVFRRGVEEEFFIARPAAEEARDE